MWSTVRLTKWPSTIGIRFVITLHSLPALWAPGTRRPHHDSELISCYHDAFRTWGHYHNNIVLFYHDSRITRSHFMDPTDRAIKGFYCTTLCLHAEFVATDWDGWGCEVSCGGHHRPRGKTTTGSALDGAQILAYLVHNMSRSQLYLGFGHFGWLTSFFDQ